MVVNYNEAGWMEIVAITKNADTHEHVNDSVQKALNMLYLRRGLSLGKPFLCCVKQENVCSIFTVSQSANCFGDVVGESKELSTCAQAHN